MAVSGQRGQFLNGYFSFLNFHLKNDKLTLLCLRNLVAWGQVSLRSFDKTLLEEEGTEWGWCDSNKLEFLQKEFQLSHFVHRLLLFFRFTQSVTKSQNTPMSKYLSLRIVRFPPPCPFWLPARFHAITCPILAHKFTHLSTVFGFAWLCILETSQDKVTRFPISSDQIVPLKRGWQSSNEEGRKKRWGWDSKKKPR